MQLQIQQKYPTELIVWNTVSHNAMSFQNVHYFWLSTWSDFTK